MTTDHPRPAPLALLWVSHEQEPALYHIDPKRFDHDRDPLDAMSPWHRVLLRATLYRVLAVLDEVEAPTFLPPAAD